MRLTIEAVDNGYIVEHEAEYADGVQRVSRNVFQSDYPHEGPFLGDGVQESHAMAAALRYIDSQIGPSTSRYSAARVYVRVEPGDKYTPEADAAEELAEVPSETEPENVSF